MLKLAVTSFNNFERLHMKYLCECTGSEFDGDVVLTTGGATQKVPTTHIVCKDFTTLSQKLQLARLVGHVLNIVVREYGNKPNTGAAW